MARLPRLGRVETAVEVAAVEVTALRKTYAGRAVLDGVSFTARTGQLTAVLGPNGAGKTTTVECCEGLRRPDGGTVRVLGLDPVTDAAQLRPRVGVMLQDAGLPNGARAGEVLAHVAALHADPHRPGDLLDLLGLTEHARTTVRRLSGGQRQRLALAAAIIGRPEVVFLDEPTAGLDPQARRTVWALLARLRDDGVAVLLTTHLLDEVELLAGHVVVIADGRVIAADTPEALTGAAGDALEFSGPTGVDLTRLQQRLPAAICVQETLPGRYRVTGTPDHLVDAEIVAAVTAWCADAGVTPRGLRVARRTLEDVFLDLTGRTLR